MRKTSPLPNPRKYNRMQVEQEATLLTHYLAGMSPTQELVSLYARATQKLTSATHPKQASIWQFCGRHAWALPLVDAALAHGDRYHPVRQRIFTMLAIMETQPEYNSFFLPRQRSRVY